VKPNITTIMRQRSCCRSHIANMLSNTEKNCNVQTFLMLCVCFFVLFFSMHKTVRPADTDKVANLAQHPKRLGTAALARVCAFLVLVWNSI